MPATPYDAKGLLIQSIRDDDPVIFLEHKVLYGTEGDVPEEPYTIPFGEASVVREGSDVTVVALGRMVLLAEQAAAELEREGISCEVIDPRTTSPLDTETILESVEATGRVAEVETGKLSGGVEVAVGGVLRRRVAAVGDIVPVGGLLGVIADPDVPDADVDAFVAEFQAAFVPGADEEAGPASETVTVDA